MFFFSALATPSNWCLFHSCYGVGMKYPHSHMVGTCRSPSGSSLRLVSVRASGIIKDGCWMPVEMELKSEYNVVQL